MPAGERIAFVAALSGTAAPLGRDQRDGFLLAVAQQKGLLGGIAVQVVEFDDRGDARRARKIAGRILAEGIRSPPGFTTSESALALAARLRGKPVVLVSSGAAPAALAGEGCAGNFFSTAPAEDAVHENAGAIARARGYESVALVTAPGSRSLVETAFQRGFGRPASSLDHGSGAIQRILQARPDAVYVGLPPGQVRSFLESYEQAGLFHRLPVIAPDGDGTLLGALGPEFPGLIASARWSAAMEDDSSEKFVAAFEQRYGRKPSSYAMQGYDAAIFLGEAFRALREKPVSAAAVAQALARQAASGVAGPFKLGPNRFPITQWHAWEVFNDSAGSAYLAARERTLQEYIGPHAERCGRR